MKPKVIIEPHDDNPKWLKVTPDWSVAGVDRPVSFSVIVTNRAVANRMVRAIEDGVAYPFDGVRTDVNGQTYVHVKHNVMARKASADLKRLGY